HDTDIQIALDQQRENTLKTYLDDIKDLLLNRGLKVSKPDDEVRVLARTETLATLRQLDGERKGIVMQFLSNAELVTSTSNGIRGEMVINLSYVDLSGADMFELNLRGA